MYWRYWLGGVWASPCRAGNVSGVLIVRGAGARGAGGRWRVSRRGVRGDAVRALRFGAAACCWGCALLIKMLQIKLHGKRFVEIETWGLIQKAGVWYPRDRAFSSWVTRVCQLGVLDCLGWLLFIFIFLLLFRVFCFRGIYVVVSFRKWP